MNDLVIEGCVGRGVCSSVRNACRKSNGIDQVDEKTNEIDGEGGTAENVQNIELQQPSIPSTTTENTTTYYALKQLPLHDPTKLSMLIRELKLLCSFSCECLIELEGAFLDNDEGEHEGGGNKVMLVLEYMDRGSLDNLMSSINVDNVY